VISGRPSRTSHIFTPLSGLRSFAPLVCGCPLPKHFRSVWFTEIPAAYGLSRKHFRPVFFTIAAAVFVDVPGNTMCRLTAVRTAQFCPRLFVSARRNPAYLYTSGLRSLLRGPRDTTNPPNDSENYQLCACDGPEGGAVFSGSHGSRKYHTAANYHRGARTRSAETAQPRHLRKSSKKKHITWRSVR